MCGVKYRVFELDGDKRTEKGFWPILDAYTFCALCILPQLVKTGVTGLKIVGREYTPVYQEAVTRMYRELLDLAEKGVLESFQTRLAAILRSAKDVAFAPHLFACEKKRCYYSPLFHTPYKLPP